MDKFKHLIIEGIRDIALVLKKVGLPFIVLGGAFLIFSTITGKAAIPFSNFLIAFLFLLVLLTLFENVWLERDVKSLKEKMKEIQELYKVK